MTINGLLHVFAFSMFFILAVNSSDPPELSPSPSPAPELGSDDSVPVPSSSPSPSVGSPPVPPPSDLSPSPSGDGSKSNSPRSPSPLPSPSPSPAPTPPDVSDIYVDKSVEPEDSSDEGMSGGKKVGVAFGVIAAACFVGFGGIVYKKRQENIRRAQYSRAVRQDFLRF